MEEFTAIAPSGTEAEKEKANKALWVYCRQEPKGTSWLKLSTKDLLQGFGIPKTENWNVRKERRGREIVGTENRISS